MRVGRANPMIPPGPFAILRRDPQTPSAQLKARIKWLLGLPPYSQLSVLSRKIRNLETIRPLGATRPLTSEQQHTIEGYWRRFGIRLNLSWHRLYMSVHPDTRAQWYIPEDLYYTYIEPTLNRIDLAPAYEDKNAYDYLFPDALRPVNVLRRNHGRYYDKSYREVNITEADALLTRDERCLFVKPSLNGWGGRDVRRLVVDRATVQLDGTRVTLSQLEARYGLDFVIQHEIVQHPMLAAFHKQSVNTLRIYTLRTPDVVSVASAVLRMGVNGAAVDNQTIGGLSCGVTSEGVLCSYAIDKLFRTFTAHPTSGKLFADFQVPAWSEASRLASELHQRLPYFDTASWDIAVTDQAVPMLVEVNLAGQGINLLQGNNGPLFGERTNEVLRRVFCEACG